MIKTDGITITQLPKCTNTISNYDHLPKEKLLADGWIEEVNIVPEYDAETQSLEVGSIETETVTDDDGNEVITGATVTWVAVDNPPTYDELLDLYLNEVI